MLFNGKDLRSVHPALSIKEEIPPGTAKRQIITIAGTDGEIVSDVIVERGDYLVRVNIAGRTREEAWEMREKIAAWAGSSGAATAELLPTHRPSRCYDAILSDISDPQFVRGFATVDVTFAVPRPISRSIAKGAAQGAGAMQVRIGGSSPARPVIRQTIAEDREGLAWTMDGKAILTISGSLSAGQVVEMDTRYERLIIDGADALARINPQKTKWRPGYTPGLHVFTSTDGGTMEMRWHDEWL